MRKVVLGLDEDGIVDLATSHARLFSELAAEQPQTDWTFEYSPEMFSGTELAFSKRVVDAVTEVWAPTPERKCIINLPSTVEHSHAEHLRRHDRVDASQSGAARRDRAVGASAQRSRHRHGGRRVRADGRRRSHRGLPVRQRRAHRQRRPRQRRAQPVHAGRRARARLLGHRRDPPHRRALQPAAGASAPSVCRRSGLHLVLRLAPGRDQEGLRGRQGRRHLGHALSADRSEGPRPQLRGGDPRQQPVGQGRHRLSAGEPSTGSSCRAGCRSSSARWCRR